MIRPAPRRVLTVAAGLLLLSAAPGSAQFGNGPPPLPVPPAAFDPNAPAPEPPALRENLGILFSRMDDRVRALGEEVTAEMLQQPGGNHLSEDIAELSRSLDELREALPTIRRDAFRVRQEFSGIDASWRHVRARFSGRVLGAPSVLRAAQRVDEAHGQIVEAIGLNPPPVQAAPQPSNPADEIRRLSHTLSERAEAVAYIIRAEMVTRPRGDRCIRDAAHLSQVVDRFNDSIDAYLARPEAMEAAYNDVLTFSGQAQAGIAAAGSPPRTLAAWQAFRATEDLLEAQIRFLAGSLQPVTVVVQTQPQPQPQPHLHLQPHPQPAPPQVVDVIGPIVGWSDELVHQVEAFGAAIQNAAGRIPEWPEFNVDAQRLLASAAEFRAEASQGQGLPRLALKFREVDVNWQRLARRLWRVSKGKPTGPNIDLVKAMGVTNERIHQALGMPGYSPTIFAPQ